MLRSHAERGRDHAGGVSRNGHAMVNFLPAK